MKKFILWILMVSIFLTTGCSYIKQTEGADIGQIEGIIDDNNEDEDSKSDVPENSTSKNLESSNSEINHSEKDSSDTNSSKTNSSEAVSSSSEEPKNADQKGSNLKVHFIDVGQGDSILIESAGKYMLIDAGENDKGKVVIDYLENQGVKKLDYVIATHPHSDHIGGLDDVISHFNIGKVIMPDVEHTTKTFEDVLEAISDKGLKITKAIAGKEYTIGDASFVIIAPNSKEYDNLNNYSVSIKLQNGKNSFVFTADAEVQSENEMLNSGINLDADVLKLGHHGSTTSNSDKFLDAVSPEIAVISVGEGNSYGHPHSEILQAINERNIELYRTDKQGTIIIESDGKTLTVNHDPYKISKSDISTQNNTEKSEKSNQKGNQTAVNKDNKKNTTYTTDNKKESNNTKETGNSKNITVHITKTGSKYHRAGCRHLKNSDIEVTLAEALSKGLTPCKTCNPPAN